MDLNSVTINTNNFFKLILFEGNDKYQLKHMGLALHTYNLLNLSSICHLFNILHIHLIV